MLHPPYLACSVTRNRAEKAINKILAALSANDAAAAKGSSAGGAGSAAAAADDPVASAIELTISALDVDKGAAPSPLLFNLHMRLARQYLAARTWPALRAELAQIEGRFGLAAAEAAVEASTDISRDAGAGAGPKRGGSGAGAGSSSASGVGGASEDLTRRSSQLLEVCALELSAAALLRDRQRLRAAWKRATRVAEAAVPPPATLGILHEAGGQLAMWAREFDGARLAFLEAFKAFEAAGAAEATLRCLRCHLLANMLSSSRIDPFASQETKAYEREPSIQALTALTDAFQRNDIAAFDPVLKAAAGAHSSGASSAGAGAAGAGAGTSAATSSSSAGVGAAAAGPPALVLDDFSAEFVGDLLRSVRAKALLALLPPYSRVRLTFLAAQLRMPLPDAESLCVSLILDGQLAASIDQAAQVLILKPQPAASSGGDGSSAAAAADGGGGSSGGEDRYRAITRLAGKLQALSLAVPGLGATASGQAAAVAIGKLLSDRGHG